MSETAARGTDGQGTGGQGTGGTPGYEQARDELVDVVRRLEAGTATLEESISLWERGEELAGICQRWLDGARARLDEARERTAGDAGAPDDDEPDED